jgi:hypothetical protein
MIMLNAAIAQISIKNKKLRRRKNHPLSSCMGGSHTSVVGSLG